LRASKFQFVPGVSMQNRFLIAPLWIAAFLPCQAVAVPLSLDQALELAVQGSESTRSARAAVAGAAEMAGAAGQAPDPTLRVGVDNLPVTGADRFSTTRDFMTMKRIGISQEWLSGEKRQARQAAAQASVRREAAQVDAALAETRLQTALAYLDVFYTGEDLKLTTLMQHHAHEEFEAARARLASSSGSAQDVLMLAAARGLADDDAAEVRQQLGAARVGLQRWTGMAADEVFPMPAVGTITEEGFVARHPVVAAKQREMEAARLEAEVTAGNRKPNWTWEVSYGQRSGYSDMVSFGISVPLTVAPGQRQDRDTAAKFATVNKIEAELADAIRAAQSDHRALVTNVQFLQVRTDQFRLGVLTPAQQRIAAVTAGYRSGQGSLITLFEARHAEVDARRKLLKLQRELARSQLQLAFKPVSVETSK
jgi:outer membrane protein, heavy metal efflux system